MIPAYVKELAYIGEVSRVVHKTLDTSRNVIQNYANAVKSSQPPINWFSLSCAGCLLSQSAGGETSGVINGTK